MELGEMLTFPSLLKGFIKDVLPRWLSSKESTCQCKRYSCHPWAGKTPWRRKWKPSPVFLPGKCRGQRSLAGYSPWSCKESEMTERLNRNNSIMKDEDEQRDEQTSRARSRRVSGTGDLSPSSQGLPSGADICANPEAPKPSTAGILWRRPHKSTINY